MWRPLRRPSLFGLVLQQLGSPPILLGYRFIAGAFGFFTFTQCGERPERYSEPIRFDTMPSQPSFVLKNDFAVALVMLIKHNP